MEDYKYITLIYPSGMGGNHIANLISLCEGVEPRAIVDNYEKYLEEIYFNLTKQYGYSTNVHTSYSLGSYKDDRFLLQNVHPKWINENGEFIKSLSKKFVFTTHGFAYVNSDVFHKYEFSPMKYIICKWPKSEILNNRHNLGPWIHGDNSCPTDYTSDAINERAVGTDWVKTLINNPVYFDLDIFMDTEGYEYLQVFLQDNLGLTLPIKYAKFHRLFTGFLVKNFA